MKQTAVGFLFNELWELPKDKFTWNAILSKAKEMEKQQIIDAYCIGKYINVDDREFGEKYYNETYGSKGSGMSEKPTDHIVDTNEMISSQTEISDEEIEKIVDDQFANIHSTYDEGIIYGMKLYREKLKQRQEWKN